MIRSIMFYSLFAIIVWEGFKIEISIGEHKTSFEIYSVKRFFKRK